MSLDIQVISGPNKVNAGQFNLPTKFDSRIHAAKWALSGAEVEFFKQRQSIIGTNLDAGGWAVWMDPDKKNTPYEVTVRDGKTYVLMYRDRTLNSEVNKIYGDVSKRSVHKTTSGEVKPISESGQRITGLLSEQELQSLDPGSNQEIKTPQFNSTAGSQGAVGSVNKTQSTKE